MSTTDQHVWEEPEDEPDRLEPGDFPWPPLAVNSAEPPTADYLAALSRGSITGATASLQHAAEVLRMLAAGHPQAPDGVLMQLMDRGDNAAAFLSELAELGEQCRKVARVAERATGLMILRAEQQRSRLRRRCLKGQK